MSKREENSPSPPVNAIASDQRDPGGVVAGTIGSRSTCGCGDARVEVAIRAPELGDAGAIWALVRDSGTLDVNSPYAYLLMCSHFSGTSVVAVVAGDLVGFVAAYCPPGDGDTAFVWQVGVAQSVRGQGVAGRMLDAVVDRAGARYLEATVTPSNAPSWGLFRGFARRRGVPCEETPRFGVELFPPDGDHEPENLVRIGPLTKELDRGEERTK